MRWIFPLPTGQKTPVGEQLSRSAFRELEALAGAGLSGLLPLAFAGIPREQARLLERTPLLGQSPVEGPRNGQTGRARLTAHASAPREDPDVKLLVFLEINYKPYSVKFNLLVKNS